MTDKSKGATAQASSLPTIENLFAPEIYADTAAFFSIKNGTISITFASLRFDNSESYGIAKNVIIARLVMPLSGAQGLCVGLYDYLKQQGVAPDQGSTAN